MNQTPSVQASLHCRPNVSPPITRVIHPRFHGQVVSARMDTCRPPLLSELKIHTRGKGPRNLHLVADRFHGLVNGGGLGFQHTFLVEILAQIRKTHQSTRASYSTYFNKYQNKRLPPQHRDSALQEQMAPLLHLPACMNTRWN